MSGPEKPFDANSARRWDERLSTGEWEANNGPAITESFGWLMLATMPQELRRIFETPGVTVLDWGCALGQLAGRVKEVYPQAEVFGWDTSEAGIAKAQALFPDVKFSTLWLHPPQWDVVICSNVYEHIAEYELSLQANLDRARKAHVVLVPHNEWLGDEAEALPDAAAREADGWTHIHRFNGRDFPKYDGWLRIFTYGYPGPAWPGEQMMVTYLREEVVFSRTGRESQ